MEPLPTHVDSTMINCFRQCPEKFYNEFVLGLRPKGISIDLHAGGCFASGLEAFYIEYHTSHNTELALAKAHEVFMLTWGDFEIPEYKLKTTAKTCERVWEAIEFYVTQYPPDTDTVQPLFLEGKPTLEFTFAIPLDLPEFPLHPSGSPFIYTGRLDMLGTYEGRTVARDEKTTGKSIGQHWAEQWDLRSQFLGYVWSCQQSGFELNTVVVRGLAIQKTQFVPAEAIKIYPQYMVEKWLKQLSRDLKRMVECSTSNYFDLNLGEACTAYGNCIFQPMCTSNTPDAWHSQYEVRHWNPLKKNPIEEKV